MYDADIKDKEKLLCWICILLHVPYYYSSVGFIFFSMFCLFYILLHVSYYSIAGFIFFCLFCLFCILLDVSYYSNVSRCH